MLIGKVESSLKDGIGEITFSSEKANCLDSKLLRLLVEKINELSINPDCKILYLKSLGKSFCAGAYLDEMKSLKTLSEAEAFYLSFGLVTVSLRDAPQPVVIRQQGPVVGGGVGILASADLAFGVKESSVKLSEFEVGIGPFVISPILERKIGGPRLMELALGGDWKDSNWSLSTGLLSRVSDSSAKLETEIQEYLDRIKRYSVKNVSAFKRFLTPPGLRESVAERAKAAAQALLNS